MIPILALAALGSWTYTGFLAEPAPAPPAPLPPPPAVAPEEPEAPEETKPAVVEPEKLTPPASPSSPAAASPPAPSAPAPTRYRLADASGQVWEHSNPAYLRRFVEGRNRSFVPQFYVPARSSRCANGQCR